MNGNETHLASLAGNPEKSVFAGSNPVSRTIPPLDEFSTSSDHGLTQEPRAFLQS
jgi:hypothetical protein